MMEATFNIPDGEQNIVHCLVKKHNLCYLRNPMRYFNTWNFAIQGAVEDYNKFNEELESLKEKYVEVDSTKAFFQRWMHLMKHFLTLKPHRGITGSILYKILWFKIPIRYTYIGCTCGKVWKHVKEQS